MDKTVILFQTLWKYKFFFEFLLDIVNTNESKIPDILFLIINPDLLNEFRKLNVLIDENIYKIKSKICWNIDLNQKSLAETSLIVIL